MLSSDASMVRTKLDAEMKRIAELYSSSSAKTTDSDPIPSIASRYLEGIELEIAESAEEESTSEPTPSPTVPPLGPSPKPHGQSHSSQASAVKSQSAGSRAISAKSGTSSGITVTTKPEDKTELEQEGSSRPCKETLFLQ